MKKNKKNYLICPKCDKKITKNSKFCPNCGLKLSIKENDKTKINFYPIIVIITLLLLSFFKLPYGYYSFMRIIVTIIFIYYAYYAHYHLNKKIWFWFFSISTITFNPIIPIHLSRETWTIINLIIIIYCLFFIIYFKRRNITKILKKICKFIFRKKKFIIISIIVIISMTCLLLFSSNDKPRDYGIWEFEDGTLVIEDDFYLNSCQNDFIDCEDFTSQQRAQIIFEDCRWNYKQNGEGPKDIHNLDLDENGIACEELPYEKDFCFSSLGNRNIYSIEDCKK